MSLPPLVEVSDFADWLDESIDEGNPRAGAILRAASVLVRSKTHRDWLVDVDQLDDATPAIDADDLEVAQTVVKQAAERKWRNPAGLVAETTGPFGSRWTEESAEGVYLTETEMEMLERFVVSASTSTGLWSLRTTRSDGPLDTVYVPVDPPGAPMPYLDASDGPW